MIKARNPVDKIFLNYAATAPIKCETAQYLQDLCSKMCEPLGAHFFSWLGLIEQTRRLLADLIGAYPSEISFFSNTSTALSVLALALPWKEGDVVLIANDEFSSNRFVWQNLASKGVQCRFFKPVAGERIAQTLAKQDLSHVRLISISAVSYCTGRLYELEEFCKFCSDHRILSCLDAIQAIGATPINCHHLNVDFLAGGAQKWLLGPIGCGYLYAKKKWLEHLFVPLVGWTSAKYPERFEIQHLDFCDEMARFEPGLPNFLPIAGLGYSLQHLKQQCWQTIFDEIKQRRQRLQEGLQSLGYELNSASTDQLAGIISAKLAPDMLPRKVQEHFDRSHISLTVRDYIRVSPHFDTPYEHIDRFLDCAELLIRKPLVAIHRPDCNKIQIHKSDCNKIQMQGVPRAWIIGATGSIGQALSFALAAKGFHLDLVASHIDDLKTIQQDIESKFHQIKVNIHCCDLSNKECVESMLLELTSPVDLMVLAFIGSDAGLVQEPMKNHQRSFLALSQISLLVNGFERCKTPNPLGIVSLTSSSAWLPLPGLGYHHALHLALWQIMQTLKLEANYSTLLYPLTPAHSKLQKRLGRTLLRYFKVSGGFDYSHPEYIALDILEHILEGKEPKLPIKTKFQIAIAHFFPKIWQKIIKKRLCI